jgi:hypothetical protein
MTDEELCGVLAPGVATYNAMTYKGELRFTTVLYS